MWTKLDKPCDQVPVAVLDLRQASDPKNTAPCETATNDIPGMEAGEIATQARIDTLNDETAASTRSKSAPPRPPLSLASSRPTPSSSRSLGVYVMESYADVCQEPPISTYSSTPSPPRSPSPPNA